MERVIALVTARRARGSVSLEIVHVAGGGLVLARFDGEVVAAATEVRQVAERAVARAAATRWPWASVRQTPAGGAIGAWLVVEEVA